MKHRNKQENRMNFKTTFLTLLILVLYIAAAMIAILSIHLQLIATLDWKLLISLIEVDLLHIRTQAIELRWARTGNLWPCRDIIVHELRLMMLIWNAIAGNSIAIWHVTILLKLWDMTSMMIARQWLVLLLETISDHRRWLMMIAIGGQRWAATFYRNATCVCGWIVSGKWTRRVGESHLAQLLLLIAYLILLVVEAL